MTVPGTTSPRMPARAPSPDLSPTSAHPRALDAESFPPNGQARVLIENVRPEIDAGRYPIKRVLGDRVGIQADVFADGHDVVVAMLRYRRETESEWVEVPMHPLPNDRWEGEFKVVELGRYRYTVLGWVDHFRSWRRDFERRLPAGVDIPVNLLVGAELIEQAAARATAEDAARLRAWADKLRQGTDLDARVHLAISEELLQVMVRYPDRQHVTHYGRELAIVVDPPRARFSTWYELFPRSCAAIPGQHGTFKDCEKQLPRIAEMGFDVLYLPPIHPIGRSFRKGKNNNPTAGPTEPGSPWGIGAVEGGHKAIHPQLGTLEDFLHLIQRARELGIEVAMDIALQCSPDHPYVRDHPEWFRRRPDGTIQYAENPPKKYQDIYPFDFETDHWAPMWEELRSIFLFWIGKGVKLFRVDNPHTKAFAFWEWAITTIKRDHPEVLFLSEAFTRPKVMYALGKLGFSQSYTYFTWRNTSWELERYFTELTQTEVREIFRPNLWPNTPDILPEYLQHGGRAAFIARLILAATLGASYGMYGPAFELGERQPLAPGKEEYINSEKYEIRHWNLDHPDSLQEIITLVNQCRKSNPALQSDEHLVFHPVDNPELVCFSKQTADRSNTILVVVNLDPHHVHTGWVHLKLDQLGIHGGEQYQLHDVISHEFYLWHGARNLVRLDPHIFPAHLFQVRRYVRTERDFDYFF